MRVLRPLAVRDARKPLWLKPKLGKQGGALEHVDDWVMVYMEKMVVGWG